MLRYGPVDPVAALHNAARWFCVSRLREIPRANQNGTPAAGLLKAIVASLEEFDPSELGSLDEARALLSEAARIARPPHTSEFVAAAISDTRDSFVQFVHTSGEAEWATATRLPYRRTLGRAESDALRASFRSLWGSWYGGPTSDEAPAHETFHVRLIETIPEGPAKVWQAIKERGVTRVVELKEIELSQELDLDAASFNPNGSERFWFERSMRWMIYASHEASITFGGEWLVEEVRQIFPLASRYLYTSYDQEF